MRFFFSVDRGMFPQAVFAARTARANARARPFAAFIAVPENAIELPSLWRDEAERARWRAFFRHSPWPRLGTIWGEAPSWKKLRRYGRRRLKHAIGLPPPLRLPPDHDKILAEYKGQLRAGTYADVQQGLATFGPDGILRATPHALPQTARFSDGQG